MRPLKCFDRGWRCVLCHDHYVAFDLNFTWAKKRRIRFVPTIVDVIRRGTFGVVSE